jgi:hypothetical protein
VDTAKSGESGGNADSPAQWAGPWEQSMLRGEVSDEGERLAMVSMRENELDCGKDGHVVVSLRTRN